ncbi:hypothetical protein Tco_0172540 [Tanacetum coccineum]
MKQDRKPYSGTILSHKCYAIMLFDSGVDRSFVSTTFSALLDVTPTTLDTSYAVELADGRILRTNIVLRVASFRKVVRIPYGNEVLIIRGDNYDSEAKEKYGVEGRLEDSAIVEGREFSQSLSRILPGLPPARHI